eukprot:GHVR01011877.1.p1 GENE.GHVR01011877.1~~GHVR01011877.1.p1  ORF type:complete len:184 (+),score=38.00 GHVR01011877.1:36-587(+)
MMNINSISNNSFILTPEEKAMKRGKQCDLQMMKFYNNNKILTTGIIPIKDKETTRNNYINALQSKMEVLFDRACSRVSVAESPSIKVTLSIKFETKFGEDMCILGNSPTLGCWQPDKAAHLVWTDGHLWTVTVDVPKDFETLEYKFVLYIKSSNKIVWEDGNNHVAKIQRGGANNFEVTWGTG